ncbi:putative tetraspanin/Peripherin [Helianthus annuus]|nr:putative tetraspanin/Peripherin [Helianthus annuus]
MKFDFDKKKKKKKKTRFVFKPTQAGLFCNRAELEPEPRLCGLVAVVVIGYGVWMSSHHDGCHKSLTLPVMGLGSIIFLISVIGFLGALKNNSILLWMYLIMLCLVLMGILVFTVLVMEMILTYIIIRFIVTNNASGHDVAGLRYKEYQLQDYGSWFIKKLNNTRNWKHLQSCFVKTEVCNSLPKRYRTLKQYKLAELSPIEAGCCRPPSECGYPAVNASYYDLSFHPVSSNKDCKLYKNSKLIKCYNCDSCKAGVAQHIKTEWRVVAIFNVILFVILSMVYFVGCCARRNAARMHSKV